MAEDVDLAVPQVVLEHDPVDLGIDHLEDDVGEEVANLELVLVLDYFELFILDSVAMLFEGIANILQFAKKWEKLDIHFLAVFELKNEHPKELVKEELVEEKQESGQQYIKDQGERVHFKIIYNRMGYKRKIYSPFPKISAR